MRIPGLCDPPIPDATRVPYAEGGSLYYSNHERRAVTRQPGKVMAKPVTDSKVTAGTRLPTAMYNRIGVANNDPSPRAKARRPQHSGGRTWNQDSKQRRCAAAVG